MSEEFAKPQVVTDSAPKEAASGDVSRWNERRVSGPPTRAFSDWNAVQANPAMWR